VRSASEGIGVGDEGILLLLLRLLCVCVCGAELSCMRKADVTNLFRIRGEVVGVVVVYGIV
jgi:hypothetical protein